jgi:hypothetical protein
MRIRVTSGLFGLTHAPPEGAHLVAGSPSASRLDLGSLQRSAGEVYSVNEHSSHRERPQILYAQSLRAVSCSERKGATAVRHRILLRRTCSVLAEAAGKGYSLGGGRRLAGR